MNFHERIKVIRMGISFCKYLLSLVLNLSFLFQTSSLTRVSYGQDGSDTNLSTPGFLIPDACYALCVYVEVPVWCMVAEMLIHFCFGQVLHHPYALFTREVLPKFSGETCMHMYGVI